MNRLRRAPLVIGAVAVVVAALAFGYAVWWRPQHHNHPAATPATPTAPGTPAAMPHALAALAEPRSHPVPRLVATALRTSARSPQLGTRLIGEVVDLRTGKVLWRHDSRGESPPASTAKLLTSTAALSQLGPNFRLVTRTERVGSTLWLIGGGDVTLASEPMPGAYPEPATMPGLAAKTAQALKRAHIRTVRLAVDDDAETGPETAVGWSPSYFTEGDLAPPSALEVDEGETAPGQLTRVLHPAATAAHDFEDDLRGDGITVAAHVPPSRVPGDAKPVAAVDSPPLAQLVQQMLTNSDNDLAETLGRALARADHLQPTFVNAARAIIAADRHAGVDLAGVQLHDSSGLSHDDRVRPSALLSVLRLAVSGDHPALAPILEGLPVAGFSGTLALRYRTPDSRAGAGVVRAKTGTLTGLNSLAGLVVDRDDDLLGFALLAPDAPGAEETEPALDRIAATLATCGCRRASGQP